MRLSTEIETANGIAGTTPGGLSCAEAVSSWAVYLDFNASAPLDPRVAEVMVSALANVGNGASVHTFGRRQAAVVARAREQVAALVGRRASDVVFTGSATEANNLAITGIAQEASSDRRRILASAIEHASVLKTAECLGTRGGFQIDIVPVTDAGIVDLVALEELLGTDVLLVSVMAANGETGVINPISEVAVLAHANGALVHSDATQLVGRIPLDAKDVGIDLVSINAHKLGGPMGIGALVGTRSSLGKLSPIIHGGGHERGLRSGTLNVPGIVGFGHAARIALQEQVSTSIRIANLRDRLADRLTDELSGVVQIGDTNRRLPNTALLRFIGADAEAVVANMDPVAVSVGSACSAGSIEPSQVLIAMGMSRSAAFECVRFSLGRTTEGPEVELAIKRTVEAVEFVRRMDGRAI